MLLNLCPGSSAMILYPTTSNTHDCVMNSASPVSQLHGLCAPNVRRQRSLKLLILDRIYEQLQKDNHCITSTHSFCEASHFTPNHAEQDSLALFLQACPQLQQARPLS